MSTDNGKKEMWVSEAQKEVWEWKEALYEEIKDLPKDEQLKHLIAGAKKIREEIMSLDSQATQTF